MESLDNLTIRQRRGKSYKKGVKTIKPIYAKHTPSGSWEVELENGVIISHVFARSYSEALENVKDTPEYLSYKED